MKKMLLACFFLTIPLLACSSEEPKELQKLRGMDTEKAYENFLRLPPQVQVDLVSWELDNRRPSSSHYDFLLIRNGQKISNNLLLKAIETDNFNVNITMLLIYSDLLPQLRDENRYQVEQALSRCRVLGGNDNAECRNVRSAIQSHRKKRRKSHT